jgi:hypothetical protein
MPRRPLTAPLRIVRLLALCLVCLLPGHVASAAPLVTGGGPVTQVMTAYVIYWLPSGTHFEPSGTTAGDTSYESLTARYLNDVGQNGHANILAQYGIQPSVRPRRHHG